MKSVCLRKSVCALLAVLLVFSLSLQKCFAKNVYTMTAENSQHLEMWHYSGNYWLLGNTAGQTVKITDAQLSGIANIQGYLSANQSLTFRFLLKGNVLKGIASGGSCNVELSMPEGDCSACFDMSSLSVKLNLPYLEVTLKPKFRIVTKLGYDSFIPGLDKYIPLVDCSQGCNLYSVYKRESRVGAPDGYFNQNSVLQTETGALHPSQIINSRGLIKSGVPLGMGSSSVYASGHTVGVNTFSNAGAVGMDFRFTLIADITTISDYAGPVQYPDYYEEGEEEPVYDYVLHRKSSGK